MGRFLRFLLMSSVPAAVFGTAGCASDHAPADRTCDVVNGLRIRHSFIDRCEYNLQHKLPGPFPDVRSVTVHNTAEPLSARQERDRVSSRRDGKSVSFHFAVDENEAVQLLPLNVHAWHAGDGSRGEGNLTSIAIEICRSQCYGDSEEQYRRAEKNAAILAAWLLDLYGLPDSALKKHQDWSGKFCPHRILSEDRWESFRKEVISLRRCFVPEPGYDDSSLGAAVTYEKFEGKTVFKTFYGAMFPTPEELAADLKKRGISTLDLSSWEICSPEENARILDSLRKAGIRVRCFYAFRDGGNSRFSREDLIQTERAPGSYELYSGK